MPHKFNPASPGILGSVLIVAGLGYTGIGASWIHAPNEQRLSGVQWLGIADSVAIVGMIWVAVGIITVACGIFSRHRRVETAGTLVGLGWPILLGLYFLLAWIFRHSTDGWGVAIAYFTFAAMIVVIAAHPRPRVHTEEGTDAWD